MERNEHSRKAALIIGGAQGIGKAIARRAFAKRLEPHHRHQSHRRGLHQRGGMTRTMIYV